VIEDDLNRKLCRLHWPLQFSFVSFSHHRQKVVYSAFTLVLAILTIKERHNESSGPQKELILNVIALEQLQNLMTALQLLNPVILIDEEFEVEFFIEKAQSFYQLLKRLLDRVFRTDAVGGLDVDQLNKLLLELLVQELGLLVVDGESLAHFGHVDQLFSVLEVNARIFNYFGLHIVN